MNSVHPDRKSFGTIWKEIILTDIQDYMSMYPNCIKLIPAAEDEVWNTYVTFNECTKKNYMYNQTEVLDRHKISACYMAAIAVTRPMRFIEKIDNKNIPLAINEHAAITVALSILRSYIITAAKRDEKLNEEEKEILIAKFENGIYIPDRGLVRHGSYIDNYANELAYAVKHGKIFILSLAHELYLLELMTRKCQS